jgi:hypothetical protein
MMTKASNTVSNTLFNVAKYAGDLLDIEPIKKYNVGVEFRLTQPDEWLRVHQSAKLIPAIIALVFIGFFILLVLFSQIVESYNLFAKTQEENFILGDIDIDQNRTRDSTKAMTLKFGQIQNRGQIIIPNTASPLQLSSDIRLSDDHIDESQLIQYKETSLRKFWNCFTPRANLSTITKYSNLKQKYEVLKYCEALVVINMIWLFIANSAMTAAISPVRNVYMLKAAFETFMFALVAYGNTAPHAILFFLFFISFIKLNDYIDKIGKFKIKHYFQILLNRFITIAPIYYIVFFTFWALFTMISSKPSWYISDYWFLQCQDQVWQVLLFINQLYPFFTKCTQGCYSFQYIIPNYMLLYPLLILYVLAYRANRVVFYCLNTLTFLIGTAIFFVIPYRYNLRIGALSFEAEYLFAYLFNKPYTKMLAFAIANFTGAMYLSFHQYKNVSLEFNIL